MKLFVCTDVKRYCFGEKKLFPSNASGLAIRYIGFVLGLGCNAFGRGLGGTASVTRRMKVLLCWYHPTMVLSSEPGPLCAMYQAGIGNSDKYVVFQSVALSVFSARSFQPYIHLASGRHEAVGQYLESHRRHCDMAAFCDDRSQRTILVHFQ